MPVSLDGSLLETVSVVLLLFVLVGIGALISRFSDVDLLDSLRERFVYGVPWGTAIVIILLYFIYTVVQGAGSPGGPIVEGFRSWSLWYPQGTIFSSFTHASDGHLRGNAFGTLAFAPIAEYAWRHYPDDNARIQHPIARIGVFVLAVFLVGIAGALFVPGAVIGFSGVVFAFAGFALVMRPVLTVFAILGVQAVRLLYNAIQDPVVTAATRPRIVSPSWADTALQGHLFGVLIGVLLAVFLLRLRNERPEFMYVFFAALVFAVTRSLWAIYWFLGSEEFILYQALGAAGVLVFAGLIAVATLSPTTRSRLLPTVPLANVAVGILVVVVVILATSGLAYSLVTVSPGDDVENGIQVEDYRIAYVDSADDQYISALEIPGFGSPLSASASGIVVASDDRNAWGVAVSASRLEFNGGATVAVGDATWRELVRIDRNEWSFVDGNSTYRVSAEYEGEHLLHTASPAVSEMILNNATTQIEATAEGYELVVERNGQNERAVMPAHNETAKLGGISFERIDDDLFAEHEETRVRIAEFSQRDRPS